MFCIVVVSPEQGNLRNKKKKGYNQIFSYYCNGYFFFMKNDFSHKFRCKKSDQNITTERYDTKIADI